MPDRFRGPDTQDGWINRALADIRRQLAELASARRLVFTSVPMQADINSMNLTGEWVRYLDTVIPVPDGYTVANVMLVATTGNSMSGAASDTSQTGSIGAWAYVIGDTDAPGPGLSTGKTGGGAVSIQASMTAKVGVTQGYLSLSMFAYAVGGTWISGAGNVHLNGVVIFSRS